ncbi:unnamed protein product, partial [Amoebophrya sp. A25]
LEADKGRVFDVIDWLDIHHDNSRLRRKYLKKAPPEPPEEKGQLVNLPVAGKRGEREVAHERLQNLEDSLNWLKKSEKTRSYFAEGNNGPKSREIVDTSSNDEATAGQGPRRNSTVFYNDRGHKTRSSCSSAASSSSSRGDIGRRGDVLDADRRSSCSA